MIPGYCTISEMCRVIDRESQIFLLHLKVVFSEFCNADSALNTRMIGQCIEFENTEHCGQYSATLNYTRLKLIAGYADLLLIRISICPEVDIG